MLFQVQNHPLPAATKSSYCSLPAGAALVTGITPQGSLPFPQLSPAANRGLLHSPGHIVLQKNHSSSKIQIELV